MSTGGLPIFTYHAFETSRSVIATDPSWFAESLAMLREAGFRAVDLDAWVRGGCPQVDRGFALAFDDGLRSLLRVADVVARHGMAATVFLVSDKMGLGNDWPGQPGHIPRASVLAWSELEALSELGFGFGAHGRTHVRLDRCDYDTLVDEVHGSRDAIEQRLGRPCRLFAYPYGASNPRVRRVTARCYAAAFSTRLDLARGTRDRYQLARIDAYYLRSARALERLISGRGHAWLYMRRTLRRVSEATTTMVEASRLSYRSSRSTRRDQHGSAHEDLGVATR